MTDEPRTAARFRNDPCSSLWAVATLAAILPFIAAGCAQTRGPALVVNSHIEYNKAVSQVLKEELLLNIVRRRYMEAPLFMNVTSINSNISTTANVGAESAFQTDSDAGDIFSGSLDAGVQFTDSPTITITPRQGEDIATQLHSPIGSARVADLVAAGYSGAEAINLLVEGINNLRGPELSSDGFRPGTPEWRETVKLIESLDRDGQLIIDRFRWNDPYNDFAYPAESITPEMWITTLTTGDRRWKSYDGGKTFVYTTHEMAPAFWLDPEARQTRDGMRLMELLHVQPDVQKRIWILESARVARGADLEGRPDTPRPTLKLRMRSLYSVLNFYSYGVHVPIEHEREGRATDMSSFRASVERGEIEDYSEIFAIRFSESDPQSAYHKVKHQGHWFYIDDRDCHAKAAFNAIYDLWQLSIKTDSGQSAPVTTIQVN